MLLREHKGEPFYEAKFRYGGQQIKRRVGRAWLTRDGSGGWVPRRGRVADGYFDERRAHAAAAELVQSFVKDFNESERVEHERRTRGVTFRELAHGYLEWLEKVRGAKPAPAARAKALIAYNPDTGEVRSGQLKLGSGFEHRLIKLDGVAENRDREALADPQGYGTIEYAYWLMAGDFGIGMTECRLFPEGGRRHFMTRRFDRGEYGNRRHVQTLAAIAHLDYKQAAVHSYEEAFGVMSRLELTAEEFEQQYRRMAFDVVARNQDDHTKNVSYIMDRGGRFSLSPAYDVTHVYAPNGDWTAHHQMSVNGKRDDFSVEDFIAAGKTAKLPRGRAQTILREATDVVSQWPAYAERANVPELLADAVAGDLRLTFRRD